MSGSTVAATLAGRRPILQSQTLNHVGLIGAGNTFDIELLFANDGEMRVSRTTDGVAAVTSMLPMWWGSPVDNGGVDVAGYEIRLTVVSGSAPVADKSDATGVWIDLDAGTQVRWSLGPDFPSTAFSTTGTWLIEIRDSASGATVASGTFVINVQGL